MKRLFPIIALFSLFALSACSKDKITDPGKVNAALLGKWKLTQVNVEGIWLPYLDADVIGEFRADGTIVGTYDGASSTGTYKVVGDKLSFTQDGQSYEGSYTLTSDQLILSQFMGTSYKGKFKKL